MMTPANQVKRGSYGAIVNLQHLTTAGARRIPAILNDEGTGAPVGRATRSGPRRYGPGELRLQADSSLCAELTSGRPGVADDFSAAFGTAAGYGIPAAFAAEVGFVDLTRTDPEAATRHAVAGLVTEHDAREVTAGRWCRDGVLVIVTADAVQLAPLPQDPRSLSEHLTRELTDPPPRPTCELLRSLTIEARAVGRRVKVLRAPAPLFERAAGEWGGPGLAELCELRRSWNAARSDADRSGRALPSVVLADFLAADFPEGKDTASIWSVKGPLMDEDHVFDEFRLLAANPAWHGPVTPATQRAYAQLRETLDPDSAALILPELLS